MTLSYRIGHTLSSWLARCFYDFRVVNEAGLRFEGPALVCSNHASFFDPPFIGQAFEKPIHFFARKTLFNNPLMGATLRSWQSIPIDRDHPDTSSLKTVIRLLRGGGKVLMFPEGTRTEDGHLLPAEAGVGLFLAKARAPVLPLRLFGTFEAFPRHRILPRPSSVTLVVGEKYTPDLAARSHLSGRELYQSLADEVMQRIAALQLP